MKSITLHLDDHLSKALERLAEGTDGTPEEIAYKTIIEAALQDRVDCEDFEQNMATYASAG